MLMVIFEVINWVLYWFTAIIQNSNVVTAVLGKVMETFEVAGSSTGVGSS